MSVRQALHAGSWYESSSERLEQQLNSWLDDVNDSHSPAKAIIAPHAGYSYSGPTAAYAYKQINPEGIKRIFILGPSHHVYLSGCALTQCKTYETPIGNLKVDQKMISELHATKAFEKMSLTTDEEEHSIEMHLPYVVQVMKSNPDYTIVPILVGALSTEKEAFYGNLLAPYLNDPTNLFIISSDFCHWGQRFQYTYVNKQFDNIYESIDDLDHQGMQLIEDINPEGFAAYLKEYKNTICGRHPIAVLLHATKIAKATHSDFNPNLKFLRYAQSSQCKKPKDSSVSYASASMTVTK